MGMMDPDVEVGILHTVQILHSELNEMVGYMERAEWAKAFCLAADIAEAGEIIRKQYAHLTSDADIKELAAVRWDSDTKIKWREENKEFLEKRRAQQVRKEQTYIQQIVGKLMKGEI